MSAAPLVFLVDDLFFVAKIRTTAAALGVDAAAVKDAEALPAAAREAKLVIVDLRRPDALRALDLLVTDAPSARCVGFTDHENVEAFEAARRRGCGAVLSKRKLAAELPALVASCR